MRTLSHSYNDSKVTGINAVTVTRDVTFRYFRYIPVYWALLWEIGGNGWYKPVFMCQTRYVKKVFWPPSYVI